jgi:hypothetical protein
MCSAIASRRAQQCTTAVVHTMRAHLRCALLCTRFARAAVRAEHAPVRGPLMWATAVRAHEAHACSGPRSAGFRLLPLLGRIQRAPAPLRGRTAQGGELSPAGALLRPPGRLCARPDGRAATRSRARTRVPAQARIRMRASQRSWRLPTTPSARASQARMRVVRAHATVITRRRYMHHCR